MITKEQAIEKGFLEEKTVVLKPSPRTIEALGVTNENHIAYFMHDECSTFFCLPVTQRGVLVDVFKNDEERLYFEDVLGANLNVRKPGNIFEKENVQITMSRKMLKSGHAFDLSDPNDNIKYRIVKANTDKVAPDWESRKKKNTYRWALIDEADSKKTQEEAFNSNAEFWMAMGKYSTLADMKEVLRVYFGTTSSNKNVQADATKDILMKEFNAISENKKQRELFLKIINDKLFATKKLLIRGLSANVFKKEDIDSYIIVGEDRTYTFNELANQLYDWKQDDDDNYFLIEDRIKKAISE